MRKTRLAGIGLILGGILGILFGRIAPATSAARPSASLDTYAILAGQELRVSGLRVLDGDIGVNAGRMVVRRGLNAPLSEVSASTMQFLRPSGCTVMALFANSADPNACGTATPFTGSILGTTELQQACAFPTRVECAVTGPNALVTVAAGEKKNLAPGTYGVVNIESSRGTGGFLALAGGEYTFCKLRTDRAGVITFAAPTTINISGDVKIGDDSFVVPAAGTHLAAADLKLFIAGQRVGFRKRSNVHALVCAPFARLVLNRGARFEGRLVAQQIGADGDVTVGVSGSGGSGSTTTSTSTTTTTSRPAAVCGNGVTETGEDCDPPGALVCPAPVSTSGAFVTGSPGGGFVACTTACRCPSVTTTTHVPSSTTSTTLPGVCGNGVREAGELCDGTDFGGQTCPGGGAGLRCDACTHIDTTGCLRTRAEVCGNCIDDDGNGLTDFEDPACCLQSRTFTMTLSRGRIAGRSETSRLRLRGVLARAGLAHVDPTADDVFIQLRPEQGGAGLCAQIPAAKFVRKANGRLFRFKDADGVVDEAKGLRKVVVRILPNGSVRFMARARQAKFAGTGAGPVHVTIGFQSKAGVAENRCSVATQRFRGGKRGALVTP